MGEFSSKEISEIGNLYENIINNENQLDESDGSDYFHRQAGRVARAATNLGVSLAGSAAMGATGKDIPANSPWWDRWANYAGKVERIRRKADYTSAGEFLKGFGEKEKPFEQPPTAKPEPAKPRPRPRQPEVGTSGGLKLEGWGPFLTQKEKDAINAKMIKGYKPKSTSRVAAPKGQELGTQVPGKPETWKPSTDPELLKRYKEKRGSAQLAKDKEAQAQARKDALKLAADERATPKDEFAQARRKPDSDSASRPRREPPTAKPQPAPSRPAPAQTGDRTKDLTTWAKANKPMIQKVGTPQQKAILGAAEKGTAMPAPRPISKDIEDLKNMQKASQERQAAQSGPMYSSPDVKSKMSLRTQRMLGLTQDSYDLDAYDLVLEYLFSQGHVDTLDEAHYVMMQMDGEYIRKIVEDVYMGPPIKTETKPKVEKRKPETKPTESDPIMNYRSGKNPDGSPRKSSATESDPIILDRQGKNPDGSRKSVKPFPGPDFGR